MAILELQKRLTEVGRIRIGQKVATKNGGTRPDKLDRLRFTSPSKHYIDEIARLYGGEVKPWQAPSGPQFEVVTNAVEVPVFAPQQHIDPWYEAWGNGYCQRRCDGETEKIRDEACLCAPQIARGGQRQCKPTTRFSVMLADVPGLGVWRLETHGIYAAMELSALTDMLAGTPLPLPARLLVQPRQQKTLVNAATNDIQTRDFMVPVLLFDALTSRQLQGGAEAIAQALSGGLAVEAGPKRQAIEASAPRPAVAASKHTALQLIALVRLSQTMQSLEGLLADAQAVPDDDPNLEALRSEWARKVEQFKAAEPEPPTDVIVDAVIVDEPDAAALWNDVLAASPWPSTSDLERAFKTHQGVDMIDASGHHLAAFLAAIKSGEVTR